MPIHSPQELLVYELEAIEDAERQAAQAMEQIERDARNDRLRDLIDQRCQQGERILQEVDSCLDRLDGRSRSVQNAAARGLIQECQRMAKEVDTPEMKQAVTIAGLQGLEHYCIAAWGTVKAMAGQCGEQELAQIMERAVDEGYDWDHEMTGLAEGQVNREALEEGERGQSRHARGDGRAENRSERSGDHHERREQRSDHSGDHSGQEQRASGRDSDDLKSREYRGDDGQIHHHTRTQGEHRSR